MKRENFVAGMVTAVFTMAFLFMGVAALMYIYEQVDRPEKAGRFVPPASETFEANKITVPGNWRPVLGREGEKLDYDDNP